MEKRWISAGCYNLWTLEEKALKRYILAQCAINNHIARWESTYATGIPLNIRLRPRRLTGSISRRLFALVNESEKWLIRSLNVNSYSEYVEFNSRFATFHTATPTTLQLSVSYFTTSTSLVINKSPAIH